MSLGELKNVAYLNVPLGSLQEGDSSIRILVCDGCECSQGELLALVQLHGIKVLMGHGRTQCSMLNAQKHEVVCWKTVIIGCGVVFVVGVVVV